MALSESAEGRPGTSWPQVCESGHQHFVAVDQPHVSPPVHQTLRGLGPYRFS